MPDGKDKQSGWHLPNLKRIAVLKRQEGKRRINYGKWGYIFLIPFFAIFIGFSAIPLFQTIYYSFFRYYKDLLKQVGPDFVGGANYAAVLGNPVFWKYAGNTVLLWIIGAVPQFIVALVLAVWFTDERLNLRMKKFFQVVVYMPNLVMAAAFGMLFLMLFSTNGPISQIARALGIMSDTFQFINDTWWVRVIISFINFLMWFGNTALLLMSGIMGIEDQVFESARMDGAGGFRTFKDITMPLLMPIFVYVLITSMIGGIQMFDAPQIFTQSRGGPQATSYTVMMYLYSLISYSQNYGLAGALSVILFVFTCLISIFIFRTLTPSYNALKSQRRALVKRLRWLRFNNKDYREAVSYGNQK